MTAFLLIEIIFKICFFFTFLLLSFRYLSLIIIKVFDNDLYKSFFTSSFNSLFYLPKFDGFISNLHRHNNIMLPAKYSLVFITYKHLSKIASKMFVVCALSIVLVILYILFAAALKE